jgi:hypothetical protein
MVELRACHRYYECCSCIVLGMIVSVLVSVLEQSELPALNISILVTCQE